MAAPLVARIMVEHSGGSAAGGAGPPAGPGGGNGGSGLVDQFGVALKNSQNGDAASGKGQAAQSAISQKMLAMGKKSLEVQKSMKGGISTHIAKTMGVSFGISSILKQSQVFTGFLGSVFQLMGALVDVILAPFLPILIPAIRIMAQMIPIAAQYAKNLFNFIKPAFDLLNKWGNELSPKFKSGVKGALTAVLMGLFLTKILGFWKIMGAFRKSGTQETNHWLKRLTNKATTPGSIYVRDIAGFAQRGKGQKMAGKRGLRAGRIGMRGNLLLLGMGGMLTRGFSMLRGGLNGVFGAAQSIGDGVTRLIRTNILASDTSTSWSQRLRTKVADMWNGLKNNLDNLKTRVSNAVFRGSANTVANNIDTANKARTNADANRVKGNSALDDVGGRVDDMKAKVGQDVVDLNDTAKNKLKTLTDDFNTKVGTLTDDVNAKVGTLTDDVNVKFKTLTDDLNTKVGALDDTVGVKVGALDDTVGTKVGTLTDDLNSKVGTLNDDLNTKVKTLTDDYNSKMGTLTDDVNAKIGTLDDTVGTKVGALDDTVGTKLGTLDETVGNKMGTLTDDMNAKMKTLTDDYNGKMKTYTDDFNSKMSTLTDDVNAKVGAVDDTVGTKLKTLTDDTNGKLGTLTDDVNAKMGTLTDDVNAKFGTLTDDMNAKLKLTNTGLDDVSAKIAAADQNIVRAIDNSVVAQAKNVKNVAKRVGDVPDKAPKKSFFGRMKDTVTDALKNSPPAKAMLAGARVLKEPGGMKKFGMGVLKRVGNPLLLLKDADKVFTGGQIGKGLNAVKGVIGRNIIDPLKKGPVGRAIGAVGKKLPFIAKGAMFVGRSLPVIGAAVELGYGAYKTYDDFRKYGAKAAMIRGAATVALATGAFFDPSGITSAGASIGGHAAMDWQFEKRFERSNYGLSPEEIQIKITQENALGDQTVTHYKHKQGERQNAPHEIASTEVH